MNRKKFITTSLTATLGMTTLSAFQKISDTFSEQDEKMPVLFVGHGSPMNAIEENEFSAGWRETTSRLPKPKAILCISAHWETRGTFVTAMEKPRTIHDFYGFPQALFDVQYPAPGNPQLAQATAALFPDDKARLDLEWGLDHGCWSVLRIMYPRADVPVLQLSLDRALSPAAHYELAKALSALRKKGVLIVGSGNMVHNLGMLNFRSEKGFDWAVEINELMKNKISKNDHGSLINYNSLGSAARLVIPTAEHYLPLLYVLALKDSSKNISFFNDKTLMGSISMTSVKIG